LIRKEFNTTGNISSKNKYGVNHH